MYDGCLTFIVHRSYRCNIHLKILRVIPLAHENGGGGNDDDDDRQRQNTEIETAQHTKKPIEDYNTIKCFKQGKHTLSYRVFSGPISMLHHRNR